MSSGNLAVTSIGLALSLASGASAQTEPVFTNVIADTELYTPHYIPTYPPDGRGLIYMSGGAAAGDYDGDGLIDLYVSRFDAPHALFRNVGGGAFVDVSADAGLQALTNANGAAWGDVDGDGDLDLYVTAIYDTRFYLFMNDGQGHFTEEAQLRGAAVEGPDEHYGQSVTFGDYDLDGYLDIHVCEWRRDDLNPTGAPSNTRLLHNLGAAAPGHFEDVTESAGVQTDGLHSGGTFGFASRFSDMDADGWPDLVIVADFGSSRLFWNNRNGRFTDGTVAANLGTDENGMGSAIADYDGDGRLDWFISSIYAPECEFEPCNWGHSGNRLFRNLGNRQFSDVTDVAGVRNGFWGWGSAFFDSDNDGDLDLVHTNGIHFINDLSNPDAEFNDDPMRYFRNDGGGVMTEVSAASGITDIGNGKGLLTFDFDNDGDLDVFVCNNSDYPVLYRNDGGNTRDWLRVKTEGFYQPDGIGAKVWVTPEVGGSPMLREINSGSHFLAQSDTTAHFGLGTGTAPVAAVQVQWPITGTLQTITDVPRNSEVVITEPAPPLTVRMNGVSTVTPWSVVESTNPVTITLDIAPGPFDEPVDWYLGYMFGNSPTITWYNLDGASTTAAPLYTDLVPFSLQDGQLTSGLLPPGLVMTTVVVMAQGTTVLALDSETVVIPGAAAASSAASENGSFQTHDAAREAFERFKRDQVGTFDPDAPTSGG